MAFRVRKGSAKKYQILNVIGEGAYGIVLKCRKRSNGVLVAVKKFKPSDDTELLVKTATREVKALRKLARCGHPNIVGLIEIFKRKEQLYIVLEYAERSFLEVLEENPDGMELGLAQQLLYQLASALQFCHEHRIVHRDVKPENLLLDRYSNLKLCDFGFAKAVSKRNATRRNSDKGSMTDYVATRWYRSPELLLGSTSYGMQVDMWAMGCIMAEMVSGLPLFPGETEIDQLFLLQKLLGPLVAEHLEMFLKLKRFSGLIFPDMSNPETVVGRFGDSLNEAGVDLLTQLLQMVDTNRPTTFAVKNHPFFANYKPKNKFKAYSPKDKNRAETKELSRTMSLDVATAAAAVFGNQPNRPANGSPTKTRSKSIAIVDTSPIIERQRTKKKKNKKLNPLLPVTPGVGLSIMPKHHMKAPLLSNAHLAVDTSVKPIKNGSVNKVGKKRSFTGEKGFAAAITRTSNRGMKYPGSGRLSNKVRSVAKTCKRSGRKRSPRGAPLSTHAAAHSSNSGSSSRKGSKYKNKSLKLPTALKFRR